MMGLFCEGAPDQRFKLVDLGLLGLENLGVAIGGDLCPASETKTDSHVERAVVADDDGDSLSYALSVLGFDLCR